MVRIYGAMKRIGQSNEANNILKRMHCVAFSELHPKGRNIDDITSRIYKSTVVEGEDQNKVRDKVYKILQAGYKWQTVIHRCKERPGVLCVLGKNNT